MFLGGSRVGQSASPPLIVRIDGTYTRYGASPYKYIRIETNGKVETPEDTYSALSLAAALPSFRPPLSWALEPMIIGDADALLALRTLNGPGPL